METALWILLLAGMIAAPLVAVYLQVKSMGEPPDADAASET